MSALLGGLLLAVAAVAAAMSFEPLAKAIHRPDAVNVGGLAGMWATILLLVVAGRALLQA
jgi:hypothetical protein